MAITLEIPPEQERVLRQKAEMAGQDVATYLLRQVDWTEIPPPLSDKEWEKALDELGDTAPPDAPLLSDYAVSRAGLYEDHD